VWDQKCQKAFYNKSTSSINNIDEGSLLTHPGKVGVDGLFEGPGAMQGLHLDVGGPRLHGAIHGAPAAAALLHSASPHPSPDTKRKNINQYFMRRETTVGEKISKRWSRLDDLYVWLEARIEQERQLFLNSYMRLPTGVIGYMYVTMSLYYLNVVIYNRLDLSQI
jgi:hypothetical protein